MKKLTLFFASLLCVTCIAVAQLKLYVYQNDGTRTEFVASTVDSIAFSIITDAPNKPDDPVKPEETIETKLYFVNKASWTDVKAYIWSAEDGNYIAWPGESAYKEDYRINGYEVYSYDMSDKQLYDMIIFNGLATSTSTVLSQTSDLEIDYSKPYYCDGIWFSSVDDIVDKSGYHNGYQYVDLGLPSDTKWATMNVGATSPEDYGDYFAWGETQPKYFYDFSSYKWCNGSSDTQTKYCTDSDDGTVDNKTILELSDDAANANWGGDWRMPTGAEQDELRTECTWTWTTQNGVNGYKVNGYKVTSKSNGNSIFLPAAGYFSCDFMSGAGYLGGYYWSSSLGTNGSFFAYCLCFQSGYVDSRTFSRDLGLSVRPVLAK